MGRYHLHVELPQPVGLYSYNIYIYNINMWDLKFRFDTGKYAGITEKNTW